MKILKYIVAYTFIGAGIMSTILGVMEWMHIPFMRGLVEIAAGVFFVASGWYILEGKDDRNRDTK